MSLRILISLVFFNLFDVVVSQLAQCPLNLAPKIANCDVEYYCCGRQNAVHCSPYVQGQQEQGKWLCCVTTDFSYREIWEWVDYGYPDVYCDYPQKRTKPTLALTTTSMPMPTMAPTAYQLPDLPPTRKPTVNPAMPDTSTTPSVTTTTSSSAHPTAHPTSPPTPIPSRAPKSSDKSEKDADASDNSFLSGVSTLVLVLAGVGVVVVCVVLLLGFVCLHHYSRAKRRRRRLAPVYMSSTSGTVDTKRGSASAADSRAAARRSSRRRAPSSRMIARTSVHNNATGKSAARQSTHAGASPLDRSTISYRNLQRRTSRHANAASPSSKKSSFGVGQADLPSYVFGSDGGGVAGSDPHFYDTVPTAAPSPPSVEIESKSGASFETEYLPAPEISKSSKAQQSIYGPAPSK